MIDTIWMNIEKFFPYNLTIEIGGGRAFDMCTAWAMACLQVSHKIQPCPRANVKIPDYLVKEPRDKCRWGIYKEGARRTAYFPLSSIFFSPGWTTFKSASESSFSLPHESPPPWTEDRCQTPFPSLPLPRLTAPRHASRPAPSNPRTHSAIDSHHLPHNHPHHAPHRSTETCNTLLLRRPPLHTIIHHLLIYSYFTNVPCRLV